MPAFWAGETKIIVCQVTVADGEGGIQGHCSVQRRRAQLSPGTPYTHALEHTCVHAHTHAHTRPPFPHCLFPKILSPSGHMIGWHSCTPLKLDTATWLALANDLRAERTQVPSKGQL